MKRTIATLAATCLAFATFAFSQEAQKTEKREAHDAGPAHVHPAQDAKAARPHSSANMTWHNGAIMTDAHAEAIFWGTSWPNYTGDKISGIDDWYTGFGGSTYAVTSDEYTGTNGQVGSSVAYSGHHVDGSAAPSSSPSSSTWMATPAAIRKTTSPATRRDSPPWQTSPATNSLKPALIRATADG